VGLFLCRTNRWSYFCQGRDIIPPLYFIFVPKDRWSKFLPFFLSIPPGMPFLLPCLLAFWVVGFPNLSHRLILGRVQSAQPLLTVLIEQVLLSRPCLVLDVLRQIAFVVFLQSRPVVASVCGPGKPVMGTTLLPPVGISFPFAGVFVLMASSETLGV
jgi:hypothetical protein